MNRIESKSIAADVEMFAFAPIEMIVSIRQTHQIITANLSDI